MNRNYAFFGIVILIFLGEQLAFPQSTISLKSAPFKGWLTDSLSGSPKQMIIEKYEYVERFGDWNWEKTIEEVYRYDDDGNYTSIKKKTLDGKKNYSETYQYFPDKVEVSTTGGWESEVWFTPRKKTYYLNSSGNVMSHEIGHPDRVVNPAIIVDYEYDAKGRIVRLSTYERDCGAVSERLIRIRALSYQSINNQPTELNVYDANGSRVYQQVYEYDQNLTLKSEQWYKVDNHGKRLRLDRDFGYDAFGNLTSVFIGGRLEIQHQYQNGLVSTTTYGSAGNYHSFSYDSKNRWIEKVTYGIDYSRGETTRPKRKIIRKFVDYPNIPSTNNEN